VLCPGCGVSGLASAASSLTTAERPAGLGAGAGAVANTYRHTGGGGVLWVWPAGQELICQIRDSGHIAHPLAGRQPPAPGGAGGLGLWIAHQICDLVEIRTAPWVR
jgi:hypothetical protein